MSGDIETWTALASDTRGPGARLEEVAVVATGDGEALLLLVVLEEVSGLALVSHVGPEGHRVTVRVVLQVATLGQGRVHALHPGAGINLEKGNRLTNRIGPGYATDFPLISCLNG